MFIIYIINFLLDNKTTDPLSGFFIFKKRIYKKNKKKLFGQGYKILADIIYSCPEKLKILDCDIFFDSRKSGKSKINLLSPPGVASSNIKQCLESQLIFHNYQDSNAFTIINDYFERGIDTKKDYDYLNAKYGDLNNKKI